MSIMADSCAACVRVCARALCMDFMRAIGKFGKNEEEGKTRS